MNLLEIKWITKIILKDLKIGIGHETIFKMYHPHALDLFNATSDLKAVFEQVDEYEEKTKGGKAQTIFRMFFPVKPMLAGKQNLVQIADTVRSKGKVFVETKYDGERIQCHIQDKIVMFFSRNSNDVTPLYGPKLTEHIKENVLG